jgi:hypothetical protein
MDSRHAFFVRQQFEHYLSESEDRRKMCSLYLSLMDRFGAKLEQFGDAQTRLERL